VSKIYVYSTLTAPQEYVKWINDHGVMRAEKSVTINGGANLITGNGSRDRPGSVIYTPQGAVTEITAEEEAILLENPIFKRHLEKGFVKIDKKAMPVEKAVNDMEPRSPDAPDKASDYQPVQVRGVTIQENTRDKQQAARRMLMLS